MLSDDSIIRKVPCRVNPKQALFIDGIRHAIEMIDLSYSRLRDNLTAIALDPPQSIELSKKVPYLFLDAWAMVDAIDRFRMLYQQMPGINFNQPEDGVETLQKVTQPFRDLRNVADHLSQRADFVISRNSSALGRLSWLTGFDINPIKLWYCTLRPGTIRQEAQFRKEPIQTKFEWPTDQICLSAGGYEGNLSEIRTHIELRVKHFEIQLAAAYRRLGIEDDPVASDVFTRQAYTLAPGQFPWQNEC